MTRIALDALREGFATFDPDLKLISSNRRFGEILRLPTELRLSGGGSADVDAAPSGAR